MKIIEDLKADYDKAYHISTAEIISLVEDHLTSDEFTTLEGLVIEARNLVSDELQLITAVKMNENSYSADPFTNELIEYYRKNIEFIKNRNPSGFIHKLLPKIKSNHLNSRHLYPNFKLSPKAIAKLLAKYDAIRNIYRMLYDMKVDGIEDPKVYIEKLRADKYIEAPTKTVEIVENINIKPETNKTPIENPYPRIFKNVQTFSFFQRLQNDVRPKCQLADYSFIYRKMQKDGFINEFVSDAEFRTFLTELNIIIDRTKLLEYCITDYKMRNYNSLKDQFQLL